MPNPKEDFQNLPDDFFNDLAEESFIEDVVEDPHLNRCIEEIKLLEAKIERKKQNIRVRQDGLSNEEKLRQKALERTSRSRSQSRERRHRDRDRERRRRTKSRSRSPHRRSPYAGGRHVRDRRHNTDRSMSPVRGRPVRRTRSKSPRRSSSTHKNISFLEELAQKFAEKGQAFPEKDALLMGHNQMRPSIDPNGLPVPMDFGNVMPYEQQSIMNPPIAIPNYQQQTVRFPVQTPHQNMFYGLNPMSLMAGNAAPLSAGNLAPFPGISGQPEIPAIGGQSLPLPMQAQLQSQLSIESGFSENQKASIIDRCEHAIKQIRAKDNKVPVLKFLYNRTSLVASNANELITNTVNKSPLQPNSPLNAPFKLNSSSNVPLKTVNGLKMLPKRVRDIAQSLGINSSFLFDKMRTKVLNVQITDQIKSQLKSRSPPSTASAAVAASSSSHVPEVLIQTNTVSCTPIESINRSTQTAEFKCQRCHERNKPTTLNAHTQVFLKCCSIGVQTNEKDYREPIVELLSKMTAAQLVAIKDFAQIIDEPRAISAADYTRMRERLIDIYNLSQRDADMVRAAEESQMDETPYMDHSSTLSAGRFRDSDQLRSFDGRPSSPPPPRFHNGNFANERNSMGSGSGGGGNFSMDDRMQRSMMSDDRFQGMDPFPQRMDDDERDERERRMYLEIERQREIELEINQRRYDEQMELERLRAEQERRSMAAMHNFQQTLPFEEEMRQFNRDKEDRDMQRPNNFNAGRGTMNRRGRGAFRDNFRGRGSRR